MDDYFTDWESHAFGFGYGSGEPHIIPALRKFFELTPAAGSSGAYDYKQLEEALGPVAAWLLINVLAHHRVDVLDYGTSPRYAWLTAKGKRLRDYVLSKSDAELIELCCRQYDDECSPDACNCGPNGYIKGRVCQNPFFLDNLDGSANA